MPEGFEVSGQPPQPPADTDKWFWRWWELFRVWLVRYVESVASEVSIREIAYRSGSGDGATGGTGGGGTGGGTSADGPSDTIAAPDANVAAVSPQALFLSLDGQYRAASNTGDDPTVFTFVDEFLENGDGWDLTGTGTPTISPGLPSEVVPGAVELNTTATAGDTAELARTNTITVPCDKIDALRWVFELGLVTSSMEFYCGAGNDQTADYLGTEAVGFCYVSATSANLFGFVRVGGVTTTVDLGLDVAAGGEIINAFVRRSQAGWHFTAKAPNGEGTGSIATTSTASVEPMMRMQTTDAATKTAILDYCYLRVNTPSRFN